MTAGPSEPAEVFARVYGVDLLFDRLPDVRRSPLSKALRRRFGTVQAMGAEDGRALGFAFPDHSSQAGGSALPAQIHLLRTDQPFDPAEAAGLLEQTWGWADAEATVARGTHTVLLTDLLGAMLPYQTRLSVLRRALAAAVETLHPIALLSKPTQQVIDPGAFLTSFSGENPLFGAVNVRLFRVEDRQSGEVLMDTLGLGAIGLPDLQCHCIGLETGDIADLLFGLAHYVFVNGPVIEDGHTIAGLAGATWKCRHEQSIVGPRRDVLDVDPGPPHSCR